MKDVNKTYGVLLGHKTNLGAVGGLAKFDQKDVNMHFLMQTGDIVSLDIGSDKRYINYEKRRDMIHVHPGNYEALRKLFEEEVGAVSGMEFQIGLNRLFERRKELAQEYFVRDNIPVELRVFCLGRLMEEGTSQNQAQIRKYIHNHRTKRLPFPTRILDIFLKYTDSSEVAREALVYCMQVSPDEVIRKDPANLEKCKKTAEILGVSDEKTGRILSLSLDKLVRE